MLLSHNNKNNDNDKNNNNNNMNNMNNMNNNNNHNKSAIKICCDDLVTTMMIFEGYFLLRKFVQLSDNKDMNNKTTTTTTTTTKQD